MPHLRWIAALVLMAGGSPAFAIVNVFHVCSRHEVRDLNRTIAGQLLDFSHNHNGDFRVYSPALGMKRDIYVYLPPGYDGRTPFPVMYWFHGFGQDERNFLALVPHFDQEIRCGRMPPLVIVCPDGSITGNPSLFNAGSFYINSKAGRYEDYVMCDVCGWVTRTFCVSPHRGAHVLAGGSMGGFAAYNLGFKNRDRFGVLLGILPPLNIRYVNCKGRYFADYDPDCVGLRERARPHMTVGRFYQVILVKEERLTRPLVGYRNPDTIPFLSRENPIEMLESRDIRPGEFAMYVGYAGKDEFNLDAQARHFVDVAAGRGLTLTVQEVPDGNHRTATGVRMLPSISAFLLKEVGPFAPPGYRPPACAIPLPQPDPGKVFDAMTREP